jgi:hypothetical protein
VRSRHRVRTRTSASGPTCDGEPAFQIPGNGVTYGGLAGDTYIQVCSRHRVELRDATDASTRVETHDVVAIGNNPAPKWNEVIARETMGMVATLATEFVETMGVDGELAFALVAETMSHAERTFGSPTHGRLLDRYALEAAIELLSRPARVVDFVPDPTVCSARQSLTARSPKVKLQRVVEQSNRPDATTGPSDLNIALTDCTEWTETGEAHDYAAGKRVRPKLAEMHG